MNLDRKPHFIISQMLLHLPEGGFRLWYAGRRQPPSSNLSLAIGMANRSGVAN